jgi:hypothetical protein
MNSNTLWIFGDSYAALHEGHIDSSILPEKTQWGQILANTLKYNVNNLGVGGSPFEYSIKCFYDSLPAFKENDLIVVCLTSFTRKWIFEDNPTYSFLSMFKRMQMEEKITKNDYDFYSRYFAEIHNHKIEERHALNWITAIAYHACLKKVKCLIIPCFNSSRLDLTSLYSENFYKVSGALWDDVSLKEFSGESRLPANIMDPRRNHMCPENHEVLAEKISTTIKSNSILDLRTEFKTNLYTGKELTKTAQSWKSWLSSKK